MASADKLHQAPSPAYHATPGSILHADKDFYSSIINSSKSRILKQTIDIPPRSAKAWKVPAGSIVRFTTPEGPQVGDLNMWNAANPRERFWAARTRQLQASHVSVGDRLWSCLPFLRPMVTIVADSLKDYGVDRFGGRCHDLLGTRCDPYVNTMLTGDQYDYHCHSNLTRAVIPYNLNEYDIHDVINIFQVTGLDAQGKYFMEPSPATKDSYLEFFAEQDVIMALSACPGGDLSAWGWGEGGAGEEGENKSMKDCCRPLRAEVFELGDKGLLEGWKQFESPSYRGMHGIRVPVGEDV